MHIRFRARCILAAFSLLLPFVADAQSLAPPAYSSSEVLHLIRKTQVVGSVLYIAAHPDDENTAMLSWLNHERKVRTGYLSMTRGDGGQNLIGAEQGEPLGLIRTQELLAARRIDGAEQFFTRAFDFGYSKNPDETFRFWNKDSVLKDLVWVIRTFRPDVIITRFPTTGEGGHSHHTASALLAVDAFTAAADSTRYPEQLKYVHPWQVRRVFWNSFNFGPTSAAPEVGTLQVDLGAYNTLLGTSYTEMAGASRSQHKSQGFGAAQRRGQRNDNFKLLVGEPAKADVLEDVDVSWRRVPGAGKIADALARAEAAWRADAPHLAVPALVDAFQEAQMLAGTPYAYKIVQIQQALLAAAGIVIEATANDYSYTAGDSMRIVTTCIKRSPSAVRVAEVQSVGTALGKVAFPFSLAFNQPFAVTHAAKLAERITVTNPYWLAAPHSKGLFTVSGQQLIGKPENDAPFSSTVVLAFDKVETTVTNGHLEKETVGVPVSVPVRYKWVHPVEGEVYRPVEVLPAVTLALDERTYVFAKEEGKTIQVKLQSNSTQTQMGSVKLQVPAGWQCTPLEAPFLMKKRDAEVIVSFTVTPTAGAKNGLLKATSTVGTAQYTQGRVRIQYPHIPSQVLLPIAEVPLSRADIRTKAKRVGYVPGAGDDIVAALQQMGITATVLTNEELTSGSLQGYDAIVAGVRAYNTQERIAVWHPRLMQYVKQGGTYIVQYNTERGSLMPIDSIGPYPFKITRERVTDEVAPVTFALPEHPALNMPNKLTPADFENWVQERGIYFAGSWDSRYQAPLTFNDPGEKPNAGGLIVTGHGRGHFVYTGLVFFRQLPAGVPGAYRLFGNLLSLGK